jgi:hypothetical protein
MFSIVVFILQWQSSCSIEHMACGTKNIYSLAFYGKKKKMLAPDLQQEKSLIHN